MKCSKCGLRLTRAKEGFKTQLNSIEVERVEQWVCTNPNCEMYCGSDLSNPTKVSNRKSETIQSVEW